MKVLSSCCGGMYDFPLHPLWEYPLPTALQPTRESQSTEPALQWLACCEDCGNIYVLQPDGIVQLWREA